MKKFLLAFALTACVGMMLHARGGRDNEIRWSFWGSDYRVRITQDAVNVFESANPGYRIHIEPSGGAGDHFVRLDTQLAGRAAPDIIQMGGNFPDYVGHIMPLDDFIARGIIDGNAIDRASLDLGRYPRPGDPRGAGPLFGINTGTAFPALIYNRSLLERHGLPLPSAVPVRTWAEFQEYLQVLRAGLPADVWPMMDFGFTASASLGFGYWLRYRGYSLYLPATRSTQVTPAIATEFMNLWQNFRNLNLVPPISVAAEFGETSPAASAIVAGRVAITFLVSTQIVGWQGAMTDQLGLALPPGVGAGTQPLWPQLSQVMTINANSANPEAAARVINFMINSPEAGRILHSDRGESASSTFRSGAAAVASPERAVIGRYHDIAMPFTSPEGAHLPHDAEFNSTGFLIYQQVGFGQLTPAQGGQQLFELITRLAQ